MSITQLSTQDLRAGLKELPAWGIKEDKLHRDLKFKNFVQTWGFMTQVAMLAEQMDHHPEWFNVYNKVSIDLTTHEVGGISSRDIELAKKIDALLAMIFNG